MASSCAPHRLNLYLAYWLLTFAIAFCAPTQVEAANRRWNSLFNGAFNAAASWQGGFIPGVGDVAQFGRTTDPNVMQLNYTVDFDVSPTNQALQIEDDFVTFDLNGRTYTTTLFVGNEIGNQAGRLGKLTITDGTWRVDTANDEVYIGAAAGASGFLTVSTGGRLTGSPRVFAGLTGNGTFTVQSGGFAQAAFVSIGQADAAIGTVEVTGAGSTLNLTDLSVGQFGTGTLNITTGGLVQSTFGGVIGNFADATGTAHVAGANSRWFNIGELTIGHEGEGAMNVTAAAQVNNGNGYIGRSVGGTGAVTIAGGSDWTNFGNLFVGDAGDGELTIEANGNVFNVAATVGNVAGTTGLVTVDGPGSEWFSTGDLTIGNNGSGTLNITAGGSVANDFGQIAEGAGSTGTATGTGAGSTWTNDGVLVVGSLGTGTLTIQDGGDVSNSLQGVIAGDPGSTGSVTVTGLGSTWTMTDFLHVGDGSAGTLNILDRGAVSSTGGLIGSDTGSTGMATVSGGSTWTNTGDLFVGDDGDGELTIEASGNVFNVVATVGNVADAVGVVTVDGLGSDWESSGDLTIGNNGHGTLNITAGGSVSNDVGRIAVGAGSTGAVLVDGANSKWTSASSLQIGEMGQGSLTITNGGTVSSSSTEMGGVGNTSSITVDGAGSLLTSTGSIEIADSGPSQMTISNGGMATSDSGNLADAATAEAVVTVTGAGSTWDMTGGTGTGTLFVGEDGTGTLNILAGGAVSNVDGYIGFDPGSIGTALVSGAGSTWTNSGDLAVGDEGQGELTIANGGSVSNHVGYIGRNSNNGGDGVGAVTVTGAGSTWTNTNFVYVGYGSGGGGDGSLSVEAGGAVTCTTGFVGNVAGSHGTATVDGPGSTWTTSGTLAVGDGSLTISNGGAVVTNGLFGTLAADSTWNAEVTVVGHGSSWSLAGALLTVGFGGTAAVDILNGGNVNSFDGRIAAGTGSTGTVIVSGAGSTWTIGRRLGVGGDAGSMVSGGTATLNIQPGGTVNVAQNIVIFSGGTLRLEGGTLDAATVSFSGGGAFNFLSGTLHVGTYNGSLVNLGGTLAPGHSAGTTTITGSYAQQPAGKLAIEIGGTTPGSTYDVVNIASIAGISGQLQLALLNSFFPSGSDTFTVLTATSGLFGTFANVANGQRLTTLDSLGSFLVHYGPGSTFNANQIVLSAFLPTSLPGDFNFDGKVDAADYVVWRKGLGTTHTQNGFNIWRANFGEPAGGGSGTSANAIVPEPATLVLLILAAASWCLRRGRAA